MQCFPASPSSVIQELCQFLRRTALLQSPAVKAAGPLEAPEFRLLSPECLAAWRRPQVKNFKPGRGWETNAQAKEAQDPLAALAIQCRTP